jgi:hypothetical protein
MPGKPRWKQLIGCNVVEVAWPSFALLGAAGLAVLSIWFDFNPPPKGPRFPELNAQYRLWVLFFGAQAALWAATPFVAWEPVCALWKEVSDVQRRWAAVTAAVVALVSAILIFQLGPSSLAAKVHRYSEVPQHAIKLQVMIPLGILAAGLPILGMTLLCAALVALKADDSAGLTKHQDYQELSRSFVSQVGLIIGAATLGAGVLRTATNSRAAHADSAHAIGRAVSESEVFPVEYIIAYGLAFSLLVAIIYLPASRLLEKRARGLRKELLKSSESEDRIERRKMLTEALGLDRGWQSAIGTGVAILGPLIGSVLSLSFPK